MHPVSVAVGDFNRDGYLDLALTCYLVDGDAYLGKAAIFLGRGDGTFHPAVRYDSIGASQLAVGDVNDDGKLDLVTVGGDLSVLLGNGDGTFQPAVSYPGHRILAIALGDLNGDRKLDLVTSWSDDLGGTRATVWSNTSCPALTQAGPLDQWTWLAPCPPGVNLQSIAYGNGQFVAVGGTVETSTDGLTWVNRPVPGVLWLQKVIFASGRFVATDGHRILVSADGAHWTQQYSESNTWVWDFAYGQGRFVAAGWVTDGDNDPVEAIVTSTDGLTWTQR